MNWTNITEPTVEPIDYGYVRAHTRQDEDYEREYIEILIRVARIYAESYMNRCLISRNVQATWNNADRCVNTYGLDIPRGQARTLVSVTSASVNVPLEKCQLVRDGDRQRLRFDAAQFPVVAVYTAGYGTEPTSVPEDIRMAMAQHVAHLWRNREATTDRQQYPLAHGMEAIYGQYKVGGLIG